MLSNMSILNCEGIKRKLESRITFSVTFYNQCCSRYKFGAINSSLIGKCLRLES